MKKIRAAILSFGMSGKVFHAPFIHLHPGLELVGAWERTKHEFQKHYPDAQRFDTMEAILQDSSIDLVVVNTPTYTHYDYAKAALASGKHVVVEKAFTTTVAEAKELCTMAKDKGLKLSVFQNRRWDSDFLTFRQVIDSGDLGELVEVSLSYDRFDPNLSYKLHKELKGPGAGIVKDLGPHVIDQALSLFGKPEGVFAKLAVTRPESEVDDYFNILLYYPGLTVRLHAGYFFKEPTPSFIAHGSKGSFLKSRADVQEKQLAAGKKPDDPGYGIESEKEAGMLHLDKNGDSVKHVVKAVPGNYLQYYDGIYRALAEDKPLPVSAEEGLLVMKVIEAAFQSDMERRVMEIN